MPDDQRHPDIIIVGVGRSGTTNAARIIHDYFGICLGHIFGHTRDLSQSGKNPFNGHPGRECHVTIRYTRSMIQGGHTPEQVLDHWRRAHDDAGCTAALRGVKSTHLAAATWEEWLTIRPRLIIRTHRPRELVINSLHRWRKRRREVWERFYDEREGVMRKTVDVVHFPIKVVHVRYDGTIMSDEDLIDQLRPHVEALK